MYSNIFIWIYPFRLIDYNNNSKYEKEIFHKDLYKELKILEENLLNSITYNFRRDIGAKTNEQDVLTFLNKKL